MTRDSERHGFDRRRVLMGLGGLTTTGVLSGCTGGGEGQAESPESDGDGNTETDEETRTEADGDGGDGGGSGKRNFAFSTGPSTTMAFAMGGQLSSVLKQHSDLTMDVKATESGQQAVVLLTQGDTEMAYGSALTGIRAANQEGKFGRIEYQHQMMQVMSYYYIAVGLVVDAATDMQNYAALAGDPITVGSKDFSFFQPLHKSLTNYVMSEDDFVHRNYKLTQLGSALSSGDVTAAGGPLYINTLTPSYVQKLYSENDTRLLSFTDDVKQKIKDDPRIQTRTVANDAFGAISEFTAEDETFIPSANFVWFASDKMSTETVYNLLSTIWENKSSLPEAHAGFGPWTDAEFWTDHLVPQIPVHPGSAKFLKEHDLWRDELEVGEL